MRIIVLICFFFGFSYLYGQDDRLISEMSDSEYGLIDLNEIDSILMKSGAENLKISLEYDSILRAKSIRGLSKYIFALIEIDKKEGVIGEFNYSTILYEKATTWLNLNGISDYTQTDNLWDDINVLKLLVIELDKQELLERDLEIYNEYLFQLNQIRNFLKMENSKQSIDFEEESGEYELIDEENTDVDSASIVNSNSFKYVDIGNPFGGKNNDLQTVGASNNSIGNANQANFIIELNNYTGKSLYIYVDGVFHEKIGAGKKMNIPSNGGCSLVEVECLSGSATKRKICFVDRKRIEWIIK